MINKLPLKVLVVEDDEVDILAVRRAFQKGTTKVEITEAKTCQEAIALLETTAFDCVFLDYRLPDGNGIELVQKIRDRQILTPLVVLTGQGDEQIAVEVMKAGALDYLAKSKLSPETLARSLKSAVRVYRAEQQVLATNQRLLESEERYRLVLEGSNDGIWDWDLKSETIYSNDRLLEMMGFTVGEFVLTKDLLLSLLHPEDLDNFRGAIQNHLRHQQVLKIECRFRHQNGEYHYCMIRGKAQRHPQTHKPLRLSGIVTDITQRRRAEERSRFLASATTVLNTSLDYQTTLTNLAHLIVPNLADWCTINLTDHEQIPHLIAVAHKRQEKEELVWQLQDHNRTPQTSQVIESGTSLFNFQVAPDSLIAQQFNGNVAVNGEQIVNNEQTKLLQQLQLCSYLCVPLRTRERILGSILCVWGESCRYYTQEDLEFVEDLADRAALAIDNARLYSEAQLATENLRQANNILAQQQEQLKEAARLKSQFLAMMSHELRTPMNAIIGFSQLLLRQKSSSLNLQQSQMIERILHNGKNLLALINDILDLAKIEAKHLQLKPESLNIVQLVNLTLDSLRPLADEKQLPLEFHSNLTNTDIINDRDRLRQILVNLLSNAIKFTENGSVSVTLEEPNPQEICLRVSDTGIGIAQEHQEHIFEEFRQVDQSITRRYSGTGLGLAITKSLVDLMHGTITVESQLGKGATFLVNLPRSL